MSCKDKWAQEVAARLAEAAKVAPGQVDGGQRCDHEGCTELVNRATQRCIKGHVQGGAAEQPQYPAELDGLLCAVQELVQQEPARELDARVIEAQRFVAEGAGQVEEETAYAQGLTAVKLLLRVIAEAADQPAWQDDPRVRAARMAVGEPEESPALCELRDMLEDQGLLREDGGASTFDREDIELFWESMLAAAGGALTVDGQPADYSSSVAVDSDGDAGVTISVAYEQTPGDPHSKAKVEVYNNYLRGREEWTATELGAALESLREQAQTRLDNLLAQRNPRTRQSSGVTQQAGGAVQLDAAAVESLSALLAAAAGKLDIANGIVDSYEEGEGEEEDEDGVARFVPASFLAAMSSWQERLQKPVAAPSPALGAQTQQVLDAARRVADPRRHVRGEPLRSDVEALQAALGTAATQEWTPPSVSEVLAQNRITQTTLAQDEQVEARVGHGVALVEGVRQLEQELAQGPLAPEKLLDRLMALRQESHAAYEPTRPQYVGGAADIGRGSEGLFDNVVEQVVDGRVAQGKAATAGGVSHVEAAAYTARALWTGQVGANSQQYPMKLLRERAAQAGMPHAALASRGLVVQWLGAKSAAAARDTVIEGLRRSKRQTIVAVGKDGQQRTWRANEKVRWQDREGTEHQGVITGCGLRVVVGETREIREGLASWEEHWPDTATLQPAVEVFARHAASGGGRVLKGQPMLLSDLTLVE